MKILLALLFVSATSLNAHADDQFQHEVEFAPVVGYSTSTGLVWGAHVTYLYKVSTHVQLGAGGYLQKDDDRQFNSAHLQVDYNFSENFKNSYFVSLGATYNNYALYSDDKNSTYAFIGAGKRFVLSEKNHLSYKPFAQFYNNPRNGTTLSVFILNLSWDF